MKESVANIIWDRDAECMSADQRATLQLSRLRALVARVAERVPFYKEALAAKGITPADIRSLEDLQYLPFTTKQDLRDYYPFGLFAVPMSDIVRVHASSGTTGKPTVVGYTEQDIATWAELAARCLAAAGGTKDDVVQVAYGYGLFTGGLGLHYGAERLGATVIPISGGNSKRQIMLMADFRSTILACTPSYALNIAEVAAEEGVDIRQLPLRAGIFGAEPWSENMRKEIESKLGISAIDIYGLSEVMGPGVACECQAKDGLHIFDDHFLPEIIDPETGKQLGPGETGELVFTTLTKEGLPLLRYRTRDITKLIPEKCQCGRTHIRMARISGRTDDMLIIRGVNVFPSQIEEVLLQISETEPYYQIVVDRQGTMDSLEVWVEVSSDMFSDKVRGLEELEGKIRYQIESVLGISCRVKLVEPKTIARSEGKAKRVLDKREL